MPFKSGAGYYDPAIAKAFFKSFGKKEKIIAGTTIFEENEKSRKKTIFQKPIGKALTTKINRDLFRRRNIHRMYLLTDGEVVLTAGGNVLDTLWPGDIFGEMAVISEIPDLEREARRSATAKSVADCTLYSLDGNEVQLGLARKPEFALMLMSVMFARLRFLAARLVAQGNSENHRSNKIEPTLDAATVATLENTLDHATVVRFQGGAKIMKEGSPGTSMYVVLEGEVAVAIGRKIVEKLERGGVFGEMALVDQSPRTASAVARADCALLAINRDALIKLTQSDPEIGMAMMRSVAARLRYMNSLFV